MFLLVTIVGVVLGFAYAGLVERRFSPKDWRRWAALAPFWVLTAGLALALHTVNMKDLAPQAIQAFAGASFLETLTDSLGLRPRRRMVEVTRRDDPAASSTGASA